MNSLQYLHAIQKKTGHYSAAAIARELDLSRAFINLILKEETHFGDVPAVRIAEILGIHPAIVVADCNAERAKNEDLRAMWREVAERFKSMNLSVLHIGKSAGKPHHA